MSGGFRVGTQVREDLGSDPVTVVFEAQAHEIQDVRFVIHHELGARSRVSVSREMADRPKQDPPGPDDERVRRLADACLSESTVLWRLPATEPSCLERTYPLAPSGRRHDATGRT
jgi:hypothetical protein